jgi:phosphoglycerate kinase
MGEYATLDQAVLAGRRVILRTDLNVPTRDGAITDLTRITRAATTLREIAEKGGRVVVLSHFGRPKGVDAGLSQQFLVAPLAAAIGRKVAWSPTVVGPAALSASRALSDGEVLLMENVRFHPEEEKNDPGFAASLAALGDFYVNDAFSAAHRAHASTAALAGLLPHCAGRLMQAELEALARALDHPAKPVAALVGGAKVSTKLELLGNLVAKVDLLIIGGGMANTFLYAEGKQVGKSLCEQGLAATARDILARATAAGCTVLLPDDVVVAGAFAEQAPSRVVAADAVPADQMILDCGPASARQIVARLQGCKTLVWNGPLGAFEIKPFDAATNFVARAAAELTQQGRLLTVAGGGDTVSALAQAGVLDKFSYISTAGGAFLEWLEGKPLPGVAALCQ